MSYKRSDKQRIIDGYLANTGRNLFVPTEFIDWLAGQPDHEAYDLFYGKDDASAAREWRVEQARKFASGLRIVVETSQAKSNVVQIRVQEYPAYISPMAQRKMGGGYHAFSPEDGEAVEELRRQGVVALRTWLNRYGGAFKLLGDDVSGIERMVASYEARQETA